MKRSRIWMSIVPMIAVMVTIFCFSAQPAHQSSQTSSGIVKIVIEAAVPDYEKLDLPKKIAIKEKITHIVRKFGHFTEFFALGVTSATHTLAVYRTKGKSKNGNVLSRVLPSLLLTLLFCALYAASDEIHQIFVPGRGPAVTDVLIDTSGSLAGIIAVLPLAYLIFVCRKRKNDRGKSIRRDNNVAEHLSQQEKQPRA